MAYPARLRRVLCELYPDTRWIPVVLSDLGLNPARVDLNGPAEIVWHFALNEVSTQGSIETLTQRVLTEFGSSPHAGFLRSIGTHAAHASTSWIRIAGYGSDSGTPEWIQWLSRAVGLAVSRLGFGLITAGWHGVDYFAAEGFCVNEVLAGQQPLDRHQIITSRQRPITHRLGTQIMFDTEEEAGRFQSRLTRIAILISGMSGTEAIGQEAIQSGSLVVPITRTGEDDAAKRLIVRLLDDNAYHARFGVSSEEFLRLRGSVESAIDAAHVAQFAAGIISRVTTLMTGLT